VGAREGRGAWHATRGAGASGVRRSKAAAARSLGRGRAVAGVWWQAAAVVLVLPTTRSRRPPAHRISGGRAMAGRSTMSESLPSTSR